MDDSVNAPAWRQPNAATQRFLTLCLRSRWEPASLAQAAELAHGAEIQWEALRGFADQAGVAPLLYDCVRQRGLVPVAFEQAMEAAYQRSAMDNAVLSTALHSVLQLLAQAQAPAIVLKGAALGEALYGNSALRPMVDVDLLIHPEDTARVLDLLTAHGYVWTEVEPHAGLRLDFENELLLVAPGPAATPIELHWHLIDSPFYQRRLDAAWFWQAAQPATVADAEALVLGPEANLLYLSAHYVLHHRAQGLRWLVDIAVLLANCRRQIDWTLVLAQARAGCLVLPLQIVLGQLAGEWAAPIPQAALEEAQRLHATPEERQAVARLLAEHRPAAQRLWDDLAGLPGWRLRLRYGLSQLFPSAAYMQDRYHPAHKAWLPLTYPYRWGVGLKELLAGRREDGSP